MRPEDILAEDANYGVIDGVRVRKGSIAAFLANARILLDERQSNEAHREAERHLRELVPGVRAFGLFDVCEVRNPRLRALIESVV